MMLTRWSEVKVAAGEFKKELERDFILRRYQKWLEGELPWEDRVMDAFVKAKTHLVTSWRSFAKRVLDICGSLFGIILFSPIMAIIAIAIRLDSKGPIVYKQTRVGLHGTLFNILKFRTMKLGAESQSGPVWAKANDPRVTRIGNFLRKSHLDELPQLFNVLKGEMSLVGPRPERPYFVDELRKSIRNYDRRLYTKPGITGMAQVRRRYDETLADVKKKVRYDLFYIQKMCPILDIKLIGMTISEVVLGNGR
jgi:exopolysaccharide biosynthesis polyprenyl glycosylphosphotransferase